MTEAEVGKLIVLMKEYYPNDKESSTLQARIKAWHKILSDITYRDAEIGLMAFVSQDLKGFAPTVAQLIDKINSVKNPAIAEMTEMEAWNLVRKAVGNSSYNSEAEYNKLPDILKRIVGSPNQLKDWAMTDIKELNTVIQSNFMRSYNAKASKQKEYEALPSSIKNYIGAVINKMEGKELNQGVVKKLEGGD